MQQSHAPPKSVTSKLHSKANLKLKIAGSPIPETSKKLSIISLSKLKDYMPQNQVGLNKSQTALSNSTNDSPPFHDSTVTSYRSSTTDQSSHFHGTELERLARVSTVGLSSSSLRTPVDKKTLSGQPANIRYSRSINNQVVAQVTQQERHLLCTANTSTDSKKPLNFYTLPNRNIKVVDPVQVEHKDHLLTNSEERKRKKTESAKISDCISGFSKSIDSSLDTDSSKANKNEEHRRAFIDTKNNMTPSSLLLLQNHNYIDEQQRHINSGNYNESNHNPQVRSSDISIEKTRITATDNLDRGTVTLSKQVDEHTQRNHPQQNNDSTLSFHSTSASSPFMLNNNNQFKAQDSTGNLSAGGSVHNLTATSSANLTDSSNYVANQDVNQPLEVEALTSSDNNSNVQQNYHQQQGLHPSDFKLTTSGTHFVQYTEATSRHPTVGYHTSLQASMLENQLKFESAISGRHSYDANTTAIVDNNLSTGSSNTSSFSVAQDLVRQRVSTNSYYHNQYNLMPTPSSKSSSPASANSTPSPKTNAMHQHTSERSNHILPTNTIESQASSSQLQLDHLNQQYMPSNISNGNMNQHHQINQHYYNQQTVNAGGNQYQLNAGIHDQNYSQQPQQNHLQHIQHQTLPQIEQQQQQQQQLQHQQHHQHHLHQHHHHQQQQQQQQEHQLQQHQLQQPQHHNITNQQSIYHHLTNKAANVNNIYGNTGSGAHYQNHLQVGAAGHPTNHLMPGAHQSHLNNAAAACAAAAVVSQTLKTVANQHNRQNHYASNIANGFGSNTGNGMDTQHHQQFHSINSLNHHLSNQGSTVAHQQANLPAYHSNSIVTRKYQCKMCPQVFMSKAEMKFHNQNHMREAKPYKCLQCPKAFANSSYLSQHMRIHQGVKPYSCDICARKFTQLSHLQQHKRTHTGDKPYKCNYMNCTKQFSQLSNLQSHSRCHQLDKPYKCNSCYKCFHDEQSLLEHIPRHLESKHLKKNLCIFCGSSYQQERGLVKHFQQYHTDKTPTLVAAAIAAGTTGNTNLIASLVSSNSTNTSATPSSGSSSSSSSSSWARVNASTMVAPSI